MKILYYEINQKLSEGRLLASLINLGLSEDAIIAKIASNPVFFENGINPEQYIRGMLECLDSEIAGIDLIPLKRFQEYLKGSVISGKFANKMGRIVDTLIESKELVTTLSNKSILDPIGISMQSFVELLAYAHGLDILNIGSIFTLSLPLTSDQNRESKLIESIYQICQVNVTPQMTAEKSITWVAAAILAVLGEFQIPPFRFVQSGNIGMGSSLKSINVILGELEIAEDKENVLIQTNIDDMSPQLLSYAINRLFEAGALDIYQVPISMKKNRMGIQLNVTVRRRDEARFANLLLMETTTLGVNVRLLDHRYHAVIRMIDVETKYGKIPVKQKFVNDILIQSKPEYEAAAKIASEFQVSMEEIYNQVARQLDRRNDMV